MKTDKEYPATHSMSTAWYMVDDEGNIGIMEYNENGPVPFGVREYCVNSLVFGDELKNSNTVQIDLTDEQIYDLLKEPLPPLEAKEWFHPVIRIDLSKKDHFFELLKKYSKQISVSLCVSEKLGLYYIDCYSCLTYNNQNNCYTPKGILKTMIMEGIILEVFELQDYDLEEEEEEEIGHDNSPYYLYSQPYYNGCLQKRVFIPKNPVKISQIPEEFRERIHHIKGSFNDIETMQIAQHYPCNFFFDRTSYCAYGAKYQEAILEDGTKGFVKTDILHFPFKDFCPESNNQMCEGNCWRTCYERDKNFLENERPTVLVLISPYCENEDQHLNEVYFILHNVYMLPYIYAVPCVTKPQFYKQESDVSELFTTDYMLEVFKTGKGYFEKIIEYLNPNVIITFDNTFEILNQTYRIDNYNIEINNSIFPIYQSTEIKANKEKIETLANKQYRGIVSPMVITKEEMKELERNNIAIKIKEIND